MYEAKLIGLSDSIEEEVVLDINGLKIVGFAIVCPYQIVLNQIYPIDIYLTFLDGPKIIERREEMYGLVRVNDSYKYLLYGKVCGDKIDIGSGVRIQDELFIENSYLDGSYVEVTVDRLTIIFL